MPWKPDHKLTSRQRILDAAADLFSKQGFDQVGIDQVMEQAGLTRGAFYNHFASKSQLYREAIRSMALCNRNRLEVQQPSLQQILEGYLSMAHRQGSDLQCPLAFTVTDVSHRDEDVRSAYTETFAGFVAQLGARLPSNTDSPNELSDEALRSAAMMIGSVAIARALNDESLADSLLTACQKTLIKNLCEPK